MTPDVSSSGWQRDEDRSFDQESDVETSGSGGNVLELWSQDRKTQLRKLAGSSFTNNSSFGVPKGVVDSTGWQTSFENQEKRMGVQSYGKFLNADGTPASGTAKVEVAGNVVEESSVTGSFSVSSSPPVGVILGQSLESDEYNFRFVPAINGVDYFQEEVPFQNNVGTVQYGEVKGTVTDYDGKVVEGEPIRGQGFVSTTDSNGNYTVAAPGDTQVSIVAIGAEETATPASGQSVTLDFQFSRLKVKVVTPDFQPLEGTKVQIGGNKYTTNEKGEAILDRAKIVNYEILVAERILREVNVQQQGSLFTEIFGSTGTERGASLSLVDALNGKGVSDVRAIFASSGISAKSGKNGNVNLFSNNDDEQYVRVAYDDKRYESSLVQLDLEEGKTVKDTVELTRRDNPSTY